MYPKFKSLSMLLAMAAALSLTACKEEVFEGNDPAVEDGDYMYVSAAIALPSAGTRSATDEYDPDKDGFGDTNSDEDANGNPDYEWGYDYENDVRSLILLITNDKNQFVAYTAVNGITQAPAGYNPFDFVVNGEIKHSDLVEAYANGPLKGEGNKKVRIYAYCNYTLELVDSLTTLKQGDTTWVNWSGKVTESPSFAGQKPAITNTIWASRSFLMTNARMFETSFPDDITAWDDFADKNHPYRLTENAKDDNSAQNYDKNDLKPIYVERAAARIDFRDGSPKDNTYPLEIPVTSARPAEDDDTPAKPAETKTPFNVKLTRMALVNMSNQFYYLRRVSDNGTGKKLNDKGEDNGFSVLGREWYNSQNKTGNYVVDVNWEAKSQIKQPGATTQGPKAITPENAADHFNFTLFEKEKKAGSEYYNYNRDGWYVDKIDEILEGKPDTWDGPVGYDYDYRIWRYLTENTIPAGIDNQQTVQSTGIVFKGSILAGPDADYEYKETVMGVDGKTSEETVRYVSEEVELALLAAGKHLEFKADADPMTKEDIEAADAKAGYNYPILYSFANRLYAGVEGLVKAAAVEEGEGSTLYFAAQEVLKNWYLEYKKPEEGQDATPIKGTFKYAPQQPTPTNGNEVQTLTIKIYYDIITKGETDLNTGFAQCDVQLHSDAFGKPDAPGYDPEEAAESLFMNLAPQFEITIYRVSNEEDGEGWGYYCYYFYWNRHNDNQKSGLMGLMEFDVVRNNVYKLAVTKIGQLGHPRIPEYDPDPVDPNDPDEDPTNYLQVQIEVLPWVVRVNDIEF